MFDGLDQLKQLLESRDSMLKQLSSLWSQDPKVEVYEQTGEVKVVIHAPGLISNDNRHQWSVRVLDQNLYLRGKMDIEQSGQSDRGRFYSERRSEQFTRVIPLPAPVQRKPSSIQYKDGLITVVLDKHKGAVDAEWHALDFSKKNP